MPLQVTTVMLGVEDLARSKEFYAGLGCTVAGDYPMFVSFDLDNGSSLALYQREAAARDAGVSAEGTGFRAVSLHYVVGSREEVDSVVAAAAAAGGSVVREPEEAQWGYSGYFGDPDGHLWKVATSA